MKSPSKTSKTTSKALPGWTEVPDAEPDGIEELTPYVLEGKGGTHNCMVLRHGDDINVTLDLDDKTLLTEDELKLQKQACKKWWSKDLRKAFGVKDKEQWKAQLGIADTGCGKYGDGYKMGFHLVLNNYLTLWEHTLDTAEMREAMKTCPLQKHPVKEGSKVVDAIYSNGRKLRMVGAKKPDSEFVKKMVTHKDILAMHMPTVTAPTQSGDEKHLDPTEEALQEFEKQKSEDSSSVWCEPESLEGVVFV